jgi:hypothetical protein
MRLGREIRVATEQATGTKSLCEPICPVSPGDLPSRVPAVIPESVEIHGRRARSFEGAAIH